jgi:hypothetical protein
MTHTPVEQARRVVADLKAKLAETLSRGEVLMGEKAQISYAALVDGDAAAKKRLAQLDQDLLVVDLNASSVRAALAEAENRVRQAEGLSLAEAERQKARRALELGKSMRDHAKALDRAAKQVFEHFAALRIDMLALNGLGAVPNVNLIDVACKRALISASMGSRLQLEHIAPTERHSFTELCDRWASGVEAFAAARLGEPDKVEEAA